jgi:hypothetical protein
MGSDLASMGAACSKIALKEMRQKIYVGMRTGIERMP